MRGIDGLFLDALKAQYANVPLAVKTPAVITTPFVSTTGLKQGEPTSCSLFGFYVDDLPSYVASTAENPDCPVLDGVDVPPLLHCDDVALLSTSLEGLQRQVDSLKQYSDIWNLDISLVKTVVMQLSGETLGEDLSARPATMIQGAPLPWVKEFTYPAVMFHETKNMDLEMMQHRYTKARRAQAALRHRCATLGISNAGIQATLFDIIVRSSMGYGVEFWGPAYLATAAAQSGKDPGEVLHKGYLKRLLGVRKTTPDFGGVRGIW
jgi:hypothetical protein